MIWTPQDHVKSEALLRAWDPGGVPLPTGLFGSPYVKPQQLIAKAIIRLQIEADVMAAVAVARERQRRGELPAEFDLPALAEGMPQVVGDKGPQLEALAAQGVKEPLAYYRCAEACERALYRDGTQRVAGAGGAFPDDGGENLAPVVVVALTVVGVAAIAGLGWVGGEKVRADAEANMQIATNYATSMHQAFAAIEIAKAAYAAGQDPVFPGFVEETANRAERSGVFAFVAPLAIGAAAVGAGWLHHERRRRRSSSTATTIRRNPRRRARR